MMKEPTTQAATMIGRTFGRLTVLSQTAGPSHRRGRRWLCRCECNVETVVRDDHLRSGKTRSCGCLHRDTARALVRTHGLSDTCEFTTWSDMRCRCLSPTNVSYPDYGGRGIGIVARWDLFENFLTDMGPRPSAKHSLDRKDNDGDYGPDNCRWAVQKQQNRNRRNNKLDEESARQIRALIAIGVVQNWIARAFGVTAQTVSGIRHGRYWA